MKRCSLVLDGLEESKNRAIKRKKTGEWIRRRQESSVSDAVRELAAEDTPSYHQITAENGSGY